MYALRYTQDLSIIRTSDDVGELKTKSDYRIHIIDLTSGKVVWQNTVSERYGVVGFEGTYKVGKAQRSHFGGRWFDCELHFERDGLTATYGKCLEADNASEARRLFAASYNIG